MKKFLAFVLAMILVTSFCAVAYAANDDTNLQVIETGVTDSDITNGETTTDDTSDGNKENLGEIITDPTEPSILEEIFGGIFGSITLNDIFEGFRDFIEVIGSFDLETLFQFDSGSIAIISSYIAKVLDTIVKALQSIFGSEASGLEAIYTWLGNIIFGSIAK